MIIFLKHIPSGLMQFLKGCQDLGRKKINAKRASELNDILEINTWNVVFGNASKEVFWWTWQLAHDAIAPDSG